MLSARNGGPSRLPRCLTPLFLAVALAGLLPVNAAQDPETAANLAYGDRLLASHAKGAAAEYRIVLHIFEHVRGPDHPDTLLCRDKIAEALADWDEFEAESEELLTLLKIRRRLLGPEHLETLQTWEKYAYALSRAEKHEQAESEYRALIAVRERLLGPDHPDVPRTYFALADALSENDQNAKAEELYRSVLATRERILGAEHPDTIDCRYSLAVILDAQGNFAEAEKEYRATLASRQRVPDPEDPDQENIHLHLAGMFLFMLQPNYQEAEKEWRIVISFMEREGYSTVGYRAELAAALRGQGKLDEEEVQRRAVVQTYDTTVRGREDELLPALCKLAICLRDQGKFQEALEVVQRAENLQKKDRRLTKPPGEEVVKLREEIEAALRR